ncbi:STAS domain-containing protein [Chitinispirillales bacterium ANBcel5]|uniref:STAS domain-containing protein n=1 Tax=Cellulosispirillum alkaliphilum TaxID=3039283 RepID=UPI002A4FA4D6|nr:STAS domain-containing protein [Chitinispirillales bacterium ANBcel5]
MKVYNEFRHNWQLVRVEGKFVVKHLLEIRKLLEDTNSNPVSKKVAFDLSSTQYLDSSALQLMLNLKKRLDANGGEFAVCNPNEEIKEIFSIVGFDRIIAIYPSIDSLFKMRL